MLLRPIFRPTFVRSFIKKKKKKNGVASNHGCAPKWKTAIARSRDRVMWTIRKRRSVRAASVSHLALESHQRGALRRAGRLSLACTCVYVCTYRAVLETWDLAAAAGTSSVSTDNDPWPRASPPSAWNLRNGVPLALTRMKEARLYDTDTRRVSARHRRATDPRRRWTENDDRTSGNWETERKSTARNPSTAKVEARLIWSAPLSRAATVVPWSARASLVPSLSLPPPAFPLSLSCTHSAARSRSRDMYTCQSLTGGLTRLFPTRRQVKRRPPLSFAIL